MSDERLTSGTAPHRSPPGGGAHPVSLACADVMELLAPLTEGVLSHTSTMQVLEHGRHCPDCTRHLEQFRRFIVLEASVPVMPSPESAPRAATQRTSPFWPQWQERLSRWLDMVFPGTALPIHRGPSRSTSSNWEYAARQQAEQPLFVGQEGDVHVILHVARGLLFGRLAGPTGEPLYPMLVTLIGDQAQSSVLNQPDGTFQLRWDPEASALECQSPLGSITRYALAPEEP